MYSMTDLSQALRFAGIKSHPLLVRGKSCYTCTNAQHRERPQPFLPTIIGKGLGENVSCHFIGIAIFDFAKTEFVGHVM